MQTNQNDIYTTAKKMNIQSKYVCGWHCNSDNQYGWMVVRMEDNAILCHMGSTLKGAYGELDALKSVKAFLFDANISVNDVVFI